MPRRRRPEPGPRRERLRDVPKRRPHPAAQGVDAALIYGIHSVRAWLEARPSRLRVMLCEADASADVRDLAELARTQGIAVRVVAAESIEARLGARRHQGVVAEVAPFPYVELDALVAAAPPLLVVADQLQDPHNLGAIARSAEAAGAGGLVLPRDHCVGVTAAAEAASAGAMAWLPVARVTNLVRALAQLKQGGYWIAGLSARASDDVFDFDPPHKVVLLVGGESGIRPLVARQLDFELRIPMSGRSESLNASVAAALGLFILGRRLGLPSAGG